MTQLWLPGTTPAHVRTLDLEPLLRGEVIEAIAAILLRVGESRSKAIGQPDIFHRGDV